MSSLLTFHFYARHKQANAVSLIIKKRAGLKLQIADRRPLNVYRTGCLFLQPWSGLPKERILG